MIIVRLYSFTLLTNAIKNVLRRTSLNRSNPILILKHNQKTKNLRSNFSEPFSKKALYKYSFFMIAIGFLNSFIFNLVSINEKSFRSIFTSSILVLYEGNKKFWT